MAGANGVFDAPIPGQSLTQSPGSSPVEHPPLFVHLDEALEYVWEKLHNKKSAVQMLLMLKNNVPVETITRTLLYQGMLDTKWTVDLALQMFQTVIWQIEAIAKLKGIKYKTFNDDKAYTDFVVKLDNLSAQQDTITKANTLMADSAQPTTGSKGFPGFSFKG